MSTIYTPLPVLSAQQWATITRAELDALDAERRKHDPEFDALMILLDAQRARAMAEREPKPEVGE